MSAPRILGLAGCGLTVVSLFLPAVRYDPFLGGNLSLWQSNLCAAALLLALAIVAVYCCGAARYAPLLPIAILIYAIAGSSLLAIQTGITSQSDMAAGLESSREHGWASLVRGFTPSIHWLAWLTIFVGATSLCLASYVAATNKVKQADEQPQGE